MAIEPTEHFNWSLRDGVALVHVTSRELNQPELAQQFGSQLRALLAIRPADAMVLNFRKTHYMSSTAFGALLEFWKQTTQANVRLAICAMDPQVRVGADILSLGRFIPIFDDEADAIAEVKTPSSGAGA